MLLESCELGCDLPIEDCGKVGESSEKYLKLLPGSNLQKTCKILRKSLIFPKLFGALMAEADKKPQFAWRIVVF
jgi:hypothetical protein